MASRQARIQTKLGATFAPLALDVQNQSAAHAGHAGAGPDGESHFRVRIVSARFAGLGRVARQRLVYAALADELADGLHALSIDALAPDESG